MNEVFSLIKKEEKRQNEGLELIPSENIMFPECRQLLSSHLTNKYSEGYPKRRYYAGNFVMDEIESLAINRVKKLFKLAHANVQPHSGSPANMAIASAIAGPGGKMISQHLYQGGHLSMGQEASFTSKFFKVKYYDLTKEGEINWVQLENLAKSFRPTIIWSGGTGYTKIFNFKKYAEVAEKVGAWFVADISHIAGLVAGGAHPSPVKHAHIIMSTTHKATRGPWGAIIGVTKKGMKKDPEIGQKIDKAVFPGLQGGPHMANVAAITEMARLNMQPEFKLYARQVVLNAKAMAEIFVNKGYELVGGGTKNHMIWIDLTNKGIEGYVAHVALEAAGLYTNKQTIPFDPRSPYYPSGLRLGTPTMTTRGMKEAEAVEVAEMMDRGILIATKMVKDKFSDIGSVDKIKDQDARIGFKKAVWNEKELINLKKEVTKLCKRYPIS